MLTLLKRGVIVVMACAASAPALAQTAIPFVVNDLFVLPNSALGNYQPGPVVAYNGLGYFAATSVVNGRELWRTDGTPAGTSLVRDINPGTGSSSPTNFVVSNGLLFFTADDGTHGVEVWKTDGTATGTRMVADLTPGATQSDPGYLAATPNGLVFYEGGGPGVCRVYNGATASALVPQGACCLLGGACVATDQGGCVAAGSMWGGLGTSCAAVACNQTIVLSCCRTDKTCVYATSASCTAQGGTPNAANVPCGSCPDPALFACCSSTGVCSVGSFSSCTGSGGTFLFVTQACSPDPCPQSQFSCCLPSGQCYVMRIVADCTSRGGETPRTT
jgi:ELWxxDGT repeat protein